MSNNTQALTQPKAKGNFWMFLIPSLVGLFLFMAPISYQGDITIPVAVLAKSVQSTFGDYLVGVVSAIIAFMAAASVLFRFAKPAFIANNSFLNGLFSPSPIWLAVRVIGGIAVVMTYFQVGPQQVWEENTGGLVLEGLLPTLFSVFIFAG
ncbi:hypothetical protein AKJ18_27225, partial [Vibrio xuii]